MKQRNLNHNNDIQISFLKIKQQNLNHDDDIQELIIIR